MDPSHRIRPLAALRALRRLLKDKEDTSQVFIITSSLRGKSALRGARRLAATEAGRAVIAGRTSLLPVLCDRAALAALPAGSLGRAYYDFVTRENISAEGLVEASRVQAKFPAAAADEQLFRERIRDMHDLWHILTGYGRDPIGETCLVAFSFAQTKSPGLAAVTLLGLIRISRALRGAPILAALVEAFRHGRSAAWLPGEYIESALGEPLEALRARLRIKPPDRYREIMNGIATGRLVPVVAQQ